MADQSVRVDQLPIKTSLAANDSVVASWSNTSSTNTVLVSVQSLLSNSAFDLVVANGHVLVVANTFTPSTSSANGTKGTIAWDSSYLYVCVATNTWKRTALTTW